MDRIIINGIDAVTQKRMCAIHSYDKAMKVYQSNPDKFTKPSDKDLKWMNKNYREMLTKATHFVYGLCEDGTTVAVPKKDTRDAAQKPEQDAKEKAEDVVIYNNISINTLVNQKMADIVAKGRVASATDVRNNILRNESQHKLFICTKFAQIHRDVCVALRAFDNIIDKRFECLGCRAAGNDRGGAECVRCRNNFYPPMNFTFHSTVECDQCPYKGSACYQCKAHWTEDKTMLPTIEVYCPEYDDRVFTVVNYDQWMRIQDQAKNGKKLEWESTRISAEYARLLETKTPWLYQGCVNFATLKELSNVFTCKEAFVEYCAGMVDSINQLGTWDLDMTETETIVDGNAIYWGYETGTGKVPTTDEEYGDASYETHDGKWKNFKKHSLDANKVPATGNINTDGVKIPCYPVDDNFFVADTAMGRRTLRVCAGTRQFKKYEVAECDILKAFLQLTFYVAAGFKPLQKMVEVPDPKRPGFTKSVPQRGDYLLDETESRLIPLSDDGEEEEAYDIDTEMDCNPFSDDEDYYDKQQVMASTSIYRVQPTMLKQYSNTRGEINPDVKFECTGIN